MKASSLSDQMQWQLETYVKDKWRDSNLTETEVQEKVEELTEELVAKLIPLLERNIPL